jgi:hypothetical protein
VKKLMKDFADNGEVVTAVERVMKKLQGDVSENDKKKIKAGAKEMKSESGRPSEGREQQRGGETHSRALVPTSRLMKAALNAPYDAGRDGINQLSGGGGRAARWFDQRESL